MKNRILSALHDYQEEKRLVVIGAWESGSRTWGISRETSDYDVRFIYCGSGFDYLSMWEWPATVEYLDGPMDIVGWDILKVLRLTLQKGNVQPLEWIAACPAYCLNETLSEPLKEALTELWEPTRAAWHYHGLGIGHHKKAMNPGLVVSKRLKALMYARRAIYCRDLCSRPVPFTAEQVFRGTVMESILEAFRSGLAPHEGVLVAALEETYLDLERAPKDRVPFDNAEKARRATIADNAIRETIGLLRDDKS